MGKSWVSIKRRFLSPGQNGEEHEEMRHPDEARESEPGTSEGHEVSPAVNERPRPAVMGDSLDATGRQNEMIRVGMAQVLERLDDIAKLKDDFDALIINPVTALIT